MKRIGLLLRLLAAWVVVPNTNAGVVLTTLFSFDGTNGAGPVALVQDTNGDFYGTTLYGGVGMSQSVSGDGTVFRLAKDGTFSDPVWFDGSNGANPALLIRAADGSFYGTTHSGNGTVFKSAPDGTIVNSNLVAFTGTNGSSPVWLLQDQQGNLYGTTQFGGLYSVNSPLGNGTVFEIDTNGIFTSLAFLTGTNGDGPFILVPGADGVLYGVATGGGIGFNGFFFSGCGTIFKMTADGSFTNLFFFNGTNGCGPSWLLRGADGSLYGTTEFGGVGFNGSSLSGSGTVFKMTPDGTLIWSFELSGTNGCQPQLLMLASDGNLYGTALGGVGFDSSYPRSGYLKRDSSRPDRDATW
jgi:uncharacterized repeat protein (TIGR03803 family)